MGAGGEIGIYKGTGDVVSTTMTEHLGITMSMNITDKHGNEIIDYAPSEEQHWLPGWDPKVQGQTANTLNMTGTLDFSNSTRPDLYDKLVETYELKKTLGLDVKSDWSFNKTNKTATFIWSAKDD